jgi:DNA polymerase elongation subunit (family B)
MYQAVAYRKEDNTVHIWDDIRGYFQLKYKPYAYQKDPNGEHVALDGTKLRKVYNFDREEPNLYEADINPETRTLIDLYADSDDASVGHRVMFLDIEVDTTNGFPSTEKAENEITSIALQCASDGDPGPKYVFILDADRTVPSGNRNGVEIISVQTELELLQKFLLIYYDLRPTIITGWNIDFFDIPYLYNRLRNMLGEQLARTLSPIKDVIWLKHRDRYRISGVACLDYMALYKNFTYSEESSYSLEAISQKELGRGKIKYDGTLDQLKNADIDKFIDYNMNDVDLVVEIDSKMKLLDLARSICHKGHVPYEDVYFSTRYLDGASLVYMKRLGIVAPSKPRRDPNEPLDLLGAYVRDPNPGRYRWIYDLDMTSLYPSIIMSLNISPETKIGKISNFDGHAYVKGEERSYAFMERGQVTQLRGKELNEYLESKQYCIAANGVIYDLRQKGFIPSILERWFDERVEYKNLKKKYEKEGDHAKAEYYDRLQLVTKILLNSFYGVLGNPGFRFFDPDNAVGITSTGQQLIKFAASIIDKYYVKVLGKEGEYVIYTDTDSTFCVSEPLILHYWPDIDTSDEQLMAEKTIEVASAVQQFVNDSFNVYGKRFHNINEHKFVIKQEYVAKSGIWIAKKRYAQWIVNQEGFAKSKLDVKGLDVVRSSFPPAFRTFMAEVLQDILHFKSKESIDDKVIAFREHIKTLDILQVMFPIGVKEIKKHRTSKKPFAPKAKGAPVHSKAAINYNDLLVFNKIKSVREIIDGEKIRWTYLKANPMNISELALKGYDDPSIIVDIVKQYIDHDKIFKSAFENKLTDFYSALNWGKVPENNNLGKFFSW